MDENQSQTNPAKAAEGPGSGVPEGRRPAGMSAGEAPAPGDQPQEASGLPVENLVKVVQAEESATPVIQPGGSIGRFKPEDIQHCDFRRPAFLTSSELRKVRFRHEDFIRSLAAHLSTYLRLEVGIRLVKFQTLSYKEYADGLPSPTHLTLFRIEPLQGVGVLDMPLRLGLTLVDRLLGGSAQGVAVGAELSEIDIALLDQITLLILNEWCQLWVKVETLRTVVAGHESNGRFLNSTTPDSVMLVLSAEVRLGDCVEPFQLALPFLMFEPLARKMARAGQLPVGAAPAKSAPARWNPMLNDVPIRIRTHWHGLELSARALSLLKPGDVLRLESQDFGRVEVLFERTPKFNARLGTAGNRWAAELTEALTP